MSDSYALGAPIIGSRMRKLLPQIYATTGKTLPTGALSEAIQGEAMANMDNFYKWAMLNRQKEQFDEQMDLQRRHQKMLEDQVPGPWSKLASGATQLATPYIYGKAITGEQIIPQGVYDAIRPATDAGKSAWNSVMPTSLQIGGNRGDISVAGSNALQFAEKTDPLGMTAPSSIPGMDNTVAMSSSPVASVGMNAAPVLTNTVTGAFSPYAATAASALGSQTITPATTALAQGIANSAIGQSAPQFALNAGLSETAQGLGMEVGSVAATGAAESAAGTTAAAQAGQTGVSGMYGLGTGLAGMAVSWGLGALGVDKTIAGAMGGAVSGFMIGLKMGSIGGPLGALAGGVIGALASMISSWICGAVDKHVGMTDHEKLAMEKLKDYCKENERGWLRWYIENGEELVECIEAEEDNLVKYYSQIRIVMIEPVVALVDNGNMEEAFTLYKTMALFQFYRYAPHIPVPEDVKMRRRESHAEATAGI